MYNYHKGDKMRKPKCKEHLMDLFNKYPGIGLQNSLIDKLLRAKGYTHNRTTCSDNLKKLIEENKIRREVISRIGLSQGNDRTFFGIPETNENNDIFFTEKWFGEKCFNGIKKVKRVTETEQ